MINNMSRGLLEACFNDLQESASVADWTLCTCTQWNKFLAGEVDSVVRIGLDRGAIIFLVNTDRRGDRGAGTHWRLHALVRVHGSRFNLYIADPAGRRNGARWYQTSLQVAATVGAFTPYKLGDTCHVDCWRQPEGSTLCGAVCLAMVHYCIDNPEKDFCEGQSGFVPSAYMNIVQQFAMETQSAIDERVAKSLDSNSDDDEDLVIID